MLPCLVSEKTIITKSTDQSTKDSQSSWLLHREKSHISFQDFIQRVLEGRNTKRWEECNRMMWGHVHSYTTMMNFQRGEGGMTGEESWGHQSGIWKKAVCEEVWIQHQLNHCPCKIWQGDVDCWKILSSLLYRISWSQFFCLDFLIPRIPYSLEQEGYLYLPEVLT